MFVTVGIATWNRAALLAQTLDSLLAVRVPPGCTWEILVGDNNSTDDTRDVVARFAGRLPVRHLFEPTQGKSHALNHIVGEAKGQWVLFLDDDVVVDPGWLEAYAAVIAAHPDAALLGGPILARLEQPVGPRSRAAYLLREFPWVWGLLPFDRDFPMAPRGGEMPHGANMAICTDVIRARGFDTAKGMLGAMRVAGEDTDLLQQLMKERREGWMVAGARVQHWVPADRVGLRAFCRWHQGVGLRRAADEGPPRPGKFGLLWLRRLIARRFMQTALRWRPGNPKHAYETLAEAHTLIGYLHAR